MKFSTIAEAVFFVILIAGVFIEAGAGWAMIAAGGLGLVGAQFYGLDDEANE